MKTDFICPNLMSNRMFNGSDLDVPTEISKTYIGAQEQFWRALSAATKKKLTVGTTATTSHRRGRPVIDGVAMQVAGASYMDVGEADTHEIVKLMHESAECEHGMRTVKHEWGVNCDWHCK